jgi:sec-independent protein translocase protein TatB
MFNVGGGEILVILLIALVVLGPDKLPEYTRKTAKVLGELRRMSQGFQNEMRQAMNITGDDNASTSAGPRLLDPPSTSAPAADPSATSDTAAATEVPKGDAPMSAAPAADEPDETAAGGSSAA